MTEEDQVNAKLEEMGKAAADWPDEEFAARIVSLLILDKGLVNAWQRTIETMIKIARIRERHRNGEALTDGL